MSDNTELSKLDVMLKILQDRAARIQHKREYSGWGYERARAEDEANLAEAKQHITDLIEQYALSERIDELNDLDTYWNLSASQEKLRTARIAELVRLREKTDV